MKSISAELISPYLFSKSINDSSKVLKYLFLFVTVNGLFPKTVDKIPKNINEERRK